MPNIRVISGDEVDKLLKNKESEIMHVVEESYRLHYTKRDELPHSVFLTFKRQPQNRIIALPAYVDGSREVSGIKWISSFPANLLKGINRASALIVLNSIENGRPIALLEGSIISAKRTAASAALVVEYLKNYDINETKTIGLIGCGFIGYETVRFILSKNSHITRLFLYDLSMDRSTFFKDKVEIEFGVDVNIVSSAKDVFIEGDIIVLSTTASKPYISDNNKTSINKKIILNISLRDLDPSVIAKSFNIVDDFEHVNRAETSIHLSTKMYGKEGFHWESLDSLISGRMSVPISNIKPIVFSPFGLGVLDILLSDYCFQQAEKESVGKMLNSFFPESWNKM